MPGETMNWSAIAAVFLALAVGLGAFGAHGLKARLDANHLDIYKTAVLYHFLHALGLLVVSALPKAGDRFRRTRPIRCAGCWRRAS
jgi:uncharacterized membrane protein YgdD (TMEM256/DUF423 family)